MAKNCEMILKIDGKIKRIAYLNRQTYEIIIEIVDDEMRRIMNN